MNLFNKFPFKDKPNTAAFTCTHIINKEKPILFVSHDDDDGSWQFLCGNDHTNEEIRIVSLGTIYEIDKSVKKIANLDYGKTAYRNDENSKWIIE